MSAYGMKPLFTNKEGYLQWRKEWKSIYIHLSNEIRADKASLAEGMRNKREVTNLQRELVTKRAMAHKVMTLLEEAKLRRDRILKMQEDLKKQNALFPMEIKKCRNIDFHYNRGSNDFDFLPMWVLKCKGMSFYINHIDAQIPWSTKETPDGSTRGMIRLKYGDISIDENGNAIITSPE